MRLSFRLPPCRTRQWVQGSPPFDPLLTVTRLSDASPAGNVAAHSFLLPLIAQGISHFAVCLETTKAWSLMSVPESRKSTFLRQRHFHKISCTSSPASQGELRIRTFSSLSRLVRCRTRKLGWTDSTSALPWVQDLARSEAKTNPEMALDG